MDDESLARNLSESNEAGVELLISDCSIALTLLEMAETTQIAEDRTRRIGEAHHAYDTILQLLARLSPTHKQAKELNSGLAKLKVRLRAAGVSL